MLHLKDLTVRVAGRPLLEGASLHLPAGGRYGLVGRNGTGKTTLLKLILGEITPDAGTMRLQSSARIGIVAQEAPSGDTTPLEAVLAADTERHALLQEEHTARDPARIAEIQIRLVDIGAHAAPARAARILKGLGFDDAAQNRPLSDFSGGWRMRVALAGTLFVEPDLLLLDEPTNHLDLEATLWLDAHLRSYPRTLLIVSHDRDLLNSVPQRIVHLEQRKLTLYTGGYDTFERMRREKNSQQAKLRERQEGERARIQSFVDRFRYTASKARQAQSRVKALARMEPIAAAAIEPEINFKFPSSALPAPPLVTLDRAVVGYGDTPVLDHLDLRIDPDDRIALLGANGNGKSTFAKLIAGRMAPMSGTITPARGLRVGFFAQHQLEELHADETPIQHLQQLLKTEREEKIRGRLAAFGLIQHKAEQRVASLSGGEKARLSLALVCARDPHILILDEPTNHLDIDSRAALIEAINEFPGAVLLISHDRHLVELTADQLWLVARGRVKAWDGDLDEYRSRLLADRDGEPERAGPQGGSAPRNSPERRAKLAPLRQAAKAAERELERLQKEKSALAAKLADPKTYANGVDTVALGRRQSELKVEIETAEARWLEAEAALDTVDFV